MYAELPANIKHEIDNLNYSLDNEWSYINEKEQIEQLENSLPEYGKEPMSMINSESPKPIKTPTGGEEKQAEELLNYIQKLQKKKNALRRELNKKGILKENGNNAYDHYSYFSEAQYKKLATELFSAHLLEHKFNVLGVENIVGTNGQPNGRRVKILFALYDVETGYCEQTVVYGEGIDKGDKALYKAFTGALKSYLANTFLIATGNEPENDELDVLSAGELKAFILKYMQVSKEVTSEQVKQIEMLSPKEANALVRKCIIKNNKNGVKNNA